MSPILLVSFCSIGLVLLTIITLMGRKNRDLDILTYRASWERIQKLLPNPDNYAKAIIEADKLLDKALKELKFNGTTPAERLVSAKREFSRRDDVWIAHKFATAVYHEHKQVDRKATETALTAYLRALKDLRAI